MGWQVARCKDANPNGTEPGNQVADGAGWSWVESGDQATDRVRRSWMESGMRWGKARL